VRSIEAAANFPTNWQPKKWETDEKGCLKVEKRVALGSFRALAFVLTNSGVISFMCA